MEVSIMFHVQAALFQGSKMLTWFQMSGEEYDSDMEYSDDDCCYADYYNTEEDNDAEQMDPSRTDPEYFIYECLTVEEVERLLNESVEILSNTLQVSWNVK